MKTWIFRETGEMDYPGRGWFYDGYRPTQSFDDSMVYRKYPVLSLEALDHDPLEPIREVYERFEGLICEQGTTKMALWQAIKKAVGK